MEDFVRERGEKRGYSFAGMRARKVIDDDFENFDYILAADSANLDDLMLRCPKEHQYKLSLFMSHSHSRYEEIPDPY